jgi:RNA polymerase sigma-70 factor (ECF subfamily)
LKKPLPYSEAELVEKLKSQDTEAFSLLYDNYSSALYGLICTIVKDDEAAQDILQDVFVKIWGNISSYKREKGTLFTWMLNIARNTSIDTLRSKNKKYEIRTLESDVYMVDANHNTTINTDALGVKQAVAKLKLEHKEMIDLVYFGGYTQDEISKEMNMPLGTVKTRVRAALIELRKLFH